MKQYDVASHACIAYCGLDSPDEKFHLDLHEKFSVIYYMRNMAFFRSLPSVRHDSLVVRITFPGYHTIEKQAIRSIKVLNALCFLSYLLILLCSTNNAVFFCSKLLSSVVVLAFWPRKFFETKLSPLKNNAKISN